MQLTLGSCAHWVALLPMPAPPASTIYRYDKLSNSCISMHAKLPVPLLRVALAAPRLCSVLADTNSTPRGAISQGRNGLYQQSCTTSHATQCRGLRRYNTAVDNTFIKVAVPFFLPTASSRLHSPHMANTACSKPHSRSLVRRSGGQCVRSNLCQVAALQHVVSLRACNCECSVYVRH
jgi:hypothetical protein